MMPALLLTVLLGRPVEAHRPGPADIRTRADLDALIGRLDDKETRLAALERLIGFCALRPIVANFGSSTGDPERDALIDAAYEAVARAADPETIEMMIWSGNGEYRFWGLHRFPPEGDAAEQGPQPDNTAAWRALLPRLRQLAATGELNDRGPAQRVLIRWRGEGRFLDSLVPTETRADFLLHLLYDRNQQVLSARLDPHLLRLLNHPDGEVRRDALTYICWNHISAKMWQVRFSDAVVARVVELSRSTDDAERRRAGYALVEELHGSHPDTVRGRLIELSDDPSEHVRWNALSGLKDEADRPDVRAVLRRLLKDESPRVRYNAIVALGPERHLPELREMAAGPDADYARHAGRLLERIGAADGLETPAQK